MGEASLNSKLNEVSAQKRRDLPWRTPSLVESDGVLDLYPVLLSEFMLQQTQVKRVIPKYNAFISTFHTLEELASAPQAEVLKLWLGLGYNSRALYLHAAAKKLLHIKEIDYELLISCKGIGHNTASAILVYVKNEPHVFIETNIRTVLWWYFFKGQTGIDDKQLHAVMDNIIDEHNPREWYYLMMDHGADLKVSNRGHLGVFKAHQTQSKFEGSRRQLRAQILRSLAERPLSELQIASRHNDPRIQSVLADLLAEQLITKIGKLYGLK